MKPAQAFDGLALGTGENSLFGSCVVNARHFTAFGMIHDIAGGTMADPNVVRLMNPMNYIETRDAICTGFWRIRHGTADRDTSLAISTILATRLANNGCSVDFAMPWAQGHGGDYDLDELFSWVDSICRQVPSKR
ncbi:MAG TPA: hypothetical protein VMV44_01270 [Rectinemataceae bacterium]|nr:hypothetical protein [Rectinemataceae bacterium]